MKSAQNLPRRQPLPLTDTIVRALPSGDYRQADSKVRRLKVHVRPSGKTFVFDYKLGPAQRTITLGDMSLGVAAARKAAKKLNARLALGEDPATERDKARDGAPETFAAVVKLHLAHQRQQLRPGSYGNCERFLLDHAKPLHRLPLQAVTRRDIASCVAGIKLTGNRAGGGNATKKLLTSAISGFFNWAIEQGICEHNPAIGLTKFKVPPRDRVLSFDELHAVWLAAPDSDFGRIIRLLMLTGAREGEIAKLHRTELQDDVLRLPPTRTKNHRELILPLAPEARAILDQQLAVQDADRTLIFGSRGAGAFGNWSKAKKQLDAKIVTQRGKPLAEWRLHDLRRSFVTHLNELGVAPHIVEGLVGHQTFKPGVSAHYNYASYAAEKRTAMLRWTEHLLAVVEGRQSNVTPLRA